MSTHQPSQTRPCLPASCPISSDARAVTRCQQPVANSARTHPATRSILQSRSLAVRPSATTFPALQLKPRSLASICSRDSLRFESQPVLSGRSHCLNGNDGGIVGLPLRRQRSISIEKGRSDTEARPKAIASQGRAQACPGGPVRSRASIVMERLRLTRTAWFIGD